MSASTLSAKRLRNFCFTVNNYTEDEENKIITIEFEYLIIGHEVGESGTPHLQGYCELREQMSLKKVKSYMPRAHIEPRRGSSKEASDYCKKEGKFTELGERKIQGSRSDIKETYKLARENMNTATFLDNYEPNYSNIKVFEIARNSLQKVRDFAPYVEWIWGATGTGKTRYVYEHEPDLWISSKNLRWWMDYDNQEAVLFDDFRADFCTFHELLRILDRYPYTVEVKGGSRKFNSKRIYITCPKPPEKVYHTQEHIGQLLRRITKITKMGTETGYESE